MNIEECISIASEMLCDHGVVFPIREASFFMADILEVSISALPLRKSEFLQEPLLSLFFKKIDRRCKREPFAYIQGKVNFYKSDFIVSNKVLIPRQETEIMVDSVIKEINASFLQQPVIWDVCCGSGCIGISIKKECKHAIVSLSDISLDALHVARENAIKNQVDVEIVKSDMFVEFKNKKCHFLISNPPYLTSEELVNADAEVRDYEPKIALDGGLDGLMFYREIACSLNSVLYDNGVAFLEIGSLIGQDVKELFELYGFKCCIVQDYSGLDRFAIVKN